MGSVLRAWSLVIDFRPSDRGGAHLAEYSSYTTPGAVLSAREGSLVVAGIGRAFSRSRAGSCDLSEKSIMLAKGLVLCLHEASLSRSRTCSESKAYSAHPHSSSPAFNHASPCRLVLLSPQAPNVPRENHSTRVCLKPSQLASW